MRTAITNLIIALKTGAADTARAYAAEVTKRPKTSADRAEHAAQMAVLSGVAAIQEAAIRKAECIRDGLAYDVRITRGDDLIGDLRLETPDPVVAQAIMRDLRRGLRSEGYDVNLFATEVTQSKVIAVAEYPA